MEREEQRCSYPACEQSPLNWCAACERPICRAHASNPDAPLGCEVSCQNQRCIAIVAERNRAFLERWQGGN